MPVVNPVQPTVTQAGLAAIFNAQSTGVEFALTHIAFGTAQYVPDGSETALQAEKVRVTIAGGGRISPTQIQIYAIAQAVAGSPFFVGEVGFFGDDGTTLLAVYSSTATPNLFLSDTVSTSVSYALGLAALPASSVTVTIDPSASAALLLIGEHVAEADPHPQYVQKVNGVAFYDPTLAFNDGAQIIGDDLLIYQSAQANNIGNLPSTSPTWWVPLYNYGDTPIAGLTNASVTLTSTQAARTHITLTGALTAPLNIVFPNWVKDWTVLNETTGVFAITCKTAAGTGVVIPQNGSPTRIHGDGTNITQAPENIAPATASQNPVQLGQMGFGQGRLVLTSATAVTFKPYGGNNIIINGVPQQIPAAGVPLSNAGLTASTVYYVYASMVGGVMTLTTSATGHSTASNGVETQTGNVALTLVGMVYMNASAQFQNSGLWLGVLSWFNKLNQNISVSQPLTALTTSSTSFVQLSAAYRINFITWGEVDIRSSGYVFNSVVGTASYIVGIDAINSGTSTMEHASATGGYPGAVSTVGKFNLTEGAHYAVSSGFTNTGTASFVTDLEVNLPG
jgi:hypothetical protein